MLGGSLSINIVDIPQAILADTVGDTAIGSAMGFITMSIALGVVTGKCHTKD